MYNSGPRFSRRHGFDQADKSEHFGQDAPEAVRAGYIDIMKNRMNRSYKDIREIVCPILHVFPDNQNWTEIPNVRDEVIGLLQNAEWYKVLDVLEGTWQAIKYEEEQDKYSDMVNDLLASQNIGWVLKDGQLVVRTSGAEEHLFDEAITTLEKQGFLFARRELQEAISDISRRPDPDITGAMQHAFAALEAVAKEVSGEPGFTLGQVVKKHPDLIPRPLDEAVVKAWGFASNEARHGSEGNALSYEEAFLAVGVASAVAAYLASKLSKEPE